MCIPDYRQTAQVGIAIAIIAVYLSALVGHGFHLPGSSSVIAGDQV